MIYGFITVTVIKPIPIVNFKVGEVVEEMISLGMSRTGQKRLQVDLSPVSQQLVMQF